MGIKNRIWTGVVENIQNLTVDSDLYTDSDIRIFYESANAWIRFETFTTKELLLYGILQRTGGNARYENDANVVNVAGTFYVNDNPANLPGAATRFQTSNVNTLNVTFSIQQSTTRTTHYRCIYEHYSGVNATTYLLSTTQVFERAD